MLNSRISPKHAKSAKTVMPRGRIVDRQAYIKIPRKRVKLAKKGNDLGDFDFDLKVDRGS